MQQNQSVTALRVTSSEMSNSFSCSLTVKALAMLPLNTEPSFDEDDLSPIQPLPLFQQRENYFS
jgi:hypothetical protein